MKQWITAVLIVSVGCMTACGSLTSPTEPAATPAGNSVLVITGTNYSIVGIPSLRFAQTSFGSATTLPLSLRNSGTSTLNVTDIKLGGWLNDFRHFSVSATSATIAPNQTILVNVTFAPKFSTGICFMETELTVVGTQSGGDVQIGLHGDLPPGHC
jgi:hypothetical protein